MLQFASQVLTDAVQAQLALLKDDFVNAIYMPGPWVSQLVIASRAWSKYGHIKARVATLPEKSLMSLLTVN